MDKDLSRLEESLRPLAEEYTPPGSEVKSVIHQWIYAVANNNELFAESHGVKKRAVVKHLKKEGVYTSRGEFKRLLYSDINIKPTGNPSFKFIDLFAGIGGMRQGFESAGGVCVFSSEFEKNAQSTYFDNYGEYPFGDITNISEKDIPSYRNNYLAYKT